MDRAAESATVGRYLVGASYRHRLHFLPAKTQRLFDRHEDWRVSWK